MEKEHHHHLLVNQYDGTTSAIPAVGTWNSSILGMEVSQNDLHNSSSSGQQQQQQQQHHLSDCFFNSNWDPSAMDHHHNDPFESALSSIVSSPVAPSNGIGNGLVIRELIGRLGSICNSGEVSPQSQSQNINNGGGGSAHNTPSGYHTPLNSPPKLHLSSDNHTNNVRQGNSLSHSQSQSQSQFPGTFLHLPPSIPGLNADPGFVDRAARLSAFGGGNVAGLMGAPFGCEFSYGSMMPKLETPGNLSRELSNHLGGLGGPQDSNNNNNNASQPESGDSREGSSVSELNPAGQSAPAGRSVQNDANSRKRKPNAKSKRGTASTAKQQNKVGGGENDESPPNAKRIKQDEDAKEKDNNNNNVNDNSKGKIGGDDDGDEKQQRQHKNSNSKQSAKTTAEPPKDYIHVRARRGQATDSHSLAERVRREKISERMKFLQDLVPGCNKVTGKAVVLDEIINYVQSLQRQVEFLSMKLATVNPRLEFNMESLLSKDSFHSHNGASLPPAALYPMLDSTTTQALALPYGIYTNGTAENPFSTGNTFHRNPSDGFNEATAALQVAAQTAFGSDDLHSIVQMGFQRNQIDESMEGTKAATTAMKVEL